MLIRSMLESPAARRRASWIRCWPASVGSTWVAIVYWLVLHRAATAAWPPVSGLMYQVSTGFAEAEEQAASSPAARTRTVTRTTFRRPAGAPIQRIAEHLMCSSCNRLWVTSCACFRHAQRPAVATSARSGVRLRSGLRLHAHDSHQVGAKGAYDVAAHGRARSAVGRVGSESAPGRT